MAVVPIVMYSLMVAAVVLIFSLETADWNCDSVWGKSLCACKGEGMAYRGSTPEEADDIPTLLGRIKAGCKAEQRSIKWRRAAIFAILIMFAIWGLVITPGSLPNWTQFYTTVIICFAFLYFGFNFFSYHYNSTPEINITQALKQLKTKLDID